MSDGGDGGEVVRRLLTAAGYERSMGRVDAAVLCEESAEEIVRLQNKLRWVWRNVDRIKDWDQVPAPAKLVVDYVRDEIAKAVEVSSDGN
jgi:hypothetical protein